MLDRPSRLFVDAALAARDRPTHLATVAQVRARERLQVQSLPPGPAVLETRDIVLGGPHHTVRARVLRSLAEAPGVIVLLHGGGWVMGSLDLYDPFGRALSRRSGWTVVLVEYRLAPEHPFPAALEDAWCVLTTVIDKVEELARPDGEIVVAGDSAGGNLAAVVTRWARDGGLRIDRQILVYPVTDADLNRPSYLDEDNQLLLRRETMEWFWNHYLPDRGARTHPDASPLRAEDLAVLSPTLLVLAEHDVLLDEGLAYAERLRMAGVPVQLCILPGQFHGFVPLIGVLPASSHLLDLMVQYLGASTTVRGEGHGRRFTLPS